MAEGLTASLISIALVTGLLSLVIARRYLSQRSAWLVMAVRIGLPTAYFAWFRDRTWTILDDETYFLHGQHLLRRGFNPLSALTMAEGYTDLIGLAEGRHILYSWWNLVAQYIFGQHYYAPVFLNIVLTFIAGWYLYKLVRLLGCGAGYAHNLAVFFLLHWDIVAWSSFLNLKDIMIMTLTVIALYLLLKLSIQVTIRRTIALAAVALIFFWVRFYTPILLVIAAIFWLALHVPSGRSYLLLALVALSGVGALALLGPAYVLFYARQLDPLASVTGIARMALTPQPWSVEPAYSFLIVPGILHWLFALPAIVGGIRLWQRSRGATLLLVYLGLALFVYGSFPELQGPRHRVQFIFIIIWMQFHFLWLILPRRRIALHPRHVIRAEQAS